MRSWRSCCRGRCLRRGHADGVRSGSFQGERLVLARILDAEAIIPGGAIGDGRVLDRQGIVCAVIFRIAVPADSHPVDDREVGGVGAGHLRPSDPEGIFLHRRFDAPKTV